jgi:hypothetical protein
METSTWSGSLSHLLLRLKQEREMSRRVFYHDSRTLIFIVDIEKRYLGFDLMNLIANM